MSTPPKPPVPRFIWGTLLVLTLAAVSCLVLAIFLAPGWPQRGTQSLDDGQIHSRISSTTPERASPFLSVAEPVLPPLQTSDTQQKTLAPGITEYEVSITPTTQTSPSAEIYPAVSETKPLHKAPGRLAIIIDDMGLAPDLSQQAIDNLPPAVTFSFLPYPPDSRKQAVEAKNKGHTILIHIPMEPLPRTDETLDPGPNTLMVSDTSSTIAAKLEANLTPLADLAVGANNHMGSRFTTDKEHMRQVLTTLNAKHLYFLDSRTIAHTATREAGNGLNLTIQLFNRDIFLDDIPTEEEVRQELANAIRVAQKHGFAIAIGHPHPTTLAVLKKILPTLTPTTGVVLVSLTSH